MNDDGADTLSLGFKPIYDLLTGKQKETKAFTSIFSFIAELKNENSSKSAEIDTIVANENIATIDDIYGTNRLNNVESTALPLYHNLTIGQTLRDICTSNEYGVANKLNNHKYIQFNINQKKKYTIRVEQNNGRVSDPDLIIYSTSPFKEITRSDGANRGFEETKYTLPSGEYLLNINDARNGRKACFDVSIN